jgi:hypothetical protein
MNVERTKQVAPSFISTDKATQAVANAAHTYELFKTNPVSSKADGGAASGTANTANVLLTGQTAFEYVAKGTQTITAPGKVTGGLNIGMDQTDNDGVEITQGNFTDALRAFTIGTSPAFFLRVKFSIEDVSGTDDCFVGFRKVQAYQANIDDYTDMAGLNVISGNINIETILNNAATTTTDTTNDWADNETHELRVDVSATGVVSYKIDGAVPTTTAAFTFDSGDVVIPMLFFLNATDLAGAVIVKEWECGNLAVEV